MHIYFVIHNEDTQARGFSYFSNLGLCLFSLFVRVRYESVTDAVVMDQCTWTRGFTVARQSDQVKKYEKSLVMDQCRLKGSSILAVLVDTPNLTSGIWKYLLRVAVEFEKHIPWGRSPSGIWFLIPFSAKISSIYHMGFETILHYPSVEYRIYSGIQNLHSSVFHCRGLVNLFSLKMV